MNEMPGTGIQEELAAWIKRQANDAVQSLMDRGVVDSLIVEAKPAWILPFQLLIGKVRSRGDSGSFEWFICGDAPTDHLHSSLAETPREAARHFSLKWQLEASRTGSDDLLSEKAEALYEIVDREEFWDR